jgi:hypothetical protein
MDAQRALLAFEAEEIVSISCSHGNAGGSFKDR